jgi:iron complex outermembrane receptor protein
MKRLYWSILFFLFSSMLFAQLSGRVVDKSTNEPIHGAHILADSSMAVTNAAGYFELKKAEKKLIISHLGYISDTIEIKADENIFNISLVPAFLEMNQIIVKGNFNSYSILKMPSSVGKIEDLNNQNQNPLTFVENLNQVPGLFTQSGNTNTNRITIRGVGSRNPYGTSRIKAYYNDIPLTNGEGNTEIEDIGIESISNIEILKGAKSALYGSGLGGVLILNKPQFKNGLHGYARYGIASFQTKKSEADLQWSKNKFSVRGQFGHSVSDGWRDNSHFERTNILLDAQKETKQSFYGFFLLFTDIRSEIPSSLNEDMFRETPEMAAPNWQEVKGYEEYTKVLTAAKFKYSFFEWLDNKAILFFHSYKGYELRPFNILDDASSKLGLRNITKAEFSVFKFHLGFEAFIEEYNWQIFEQILANEGNKIAQYSETRTPVNLFINGQYLYNNKLLIEGGLSVNWLSYKINDQLKTIEDLSGNFSYKPVVSPFVGINYTLTTAMHVYTSLSHGYSAPTVVETLLPEGSPNTSLKPETGINAEIGYRYNSLNNRIMLDIGFYRLWLKNLLLTKRESEAVFYGINAGETMHSGLELSTMFYLTERYSKFPLSLRLNYHLINAKFTSFINNGSDYSNNQLPGIPQQNIWAGLRLSTKYGIDFDFQYQYIGKQYLNDANTEEIQSYQLLNIQAVYLLDLKVIELQLSGGIRNVLNEKYASMILVNAPSFGGSEPRYYYPGLPRNYYINLSFIF